LEFDMEPLWWALAYLGTGVLVALLDDRLVDYRLNADQLTGLTLFWPLAMPDLLFRLVTGRWFNTLLARPESERSREPRREESLTPDAVRRLYGNDGASLRVTFDAEGGWRKGRG
jgi:hypothetical protein